MKHIKKAACGIGRVAAAAACVAASGLQVHAQTSDLESFQRANQRAIREAQERPQPQADVFIDPPESQTAPLDSAAHDPRDCLRVQSIELTGHAEPLGPQPTLPSPPACLTASELNALLARLNAHYQAAGWITTRV